MTSESPRAGSRIIVSACLLGIRSRYDGRHARDDDAMALLSAGGAVPLCPEMLGGLPVPRSPAAIVGGGGEDVLDGKARVVNEEGVDVTEAFVEGAKQVLRVAKILGVTRAYLKRRSPSCGAGRSPGPPPPEGVTAALLRREGIEVVELG